MGSEAQLRPHRGAGSVSVVVCSFNRAHLLPAALQSLIRLDLPDGWDFDLIVVDNGSTDDTASVVADIAQSSNGRIRYAVEPTPGVAAARNRGIMLASGEWIAFFDDDQIAESQWLRELIASAQSRKIRVVGGAVRLVLPQGADGLPAEGRRLFGETPELLEPTPVGGAITLGTNNLLVHRSVFDEVGGFDPLLQEAGEDTDFMRRVAGAGIAAWLEPRAVVHHKIPTSRIEPLALLAASRRVGWGFCRRDYRAYGSLGLIWRCCARLAKLVFQGTIRYAVAQLKGDRRTLLGVRIDAARTFGYCLAVAACFLPDALKEDINLTPPSFREEVGRVATRAELD